MNSIGRMVSIMAWCEECYYWDGPQEACKICAGTGFDPIPWTELFTVGVNYGKGHLGDGTL